MKQLKIYIPEDKAVKFKVFCVEHKIPMSKAIEELIDGLLIGDIILDDKS